MGCFVCACDGWVGGWCDGGGEGCCVVRSGVVWCPRPVCAIKTSSCVLAKCPRASNNRAFLKAQTGTF